MFLCACGASGNLWTLHVHLTCQGFCPFVVFQDGASEVGVVAYACNPISWKLEAGESESKAILDYIVSLRSDLAS